MVDEEELARLRRRVAELEQQVEMLSTNARRFASLLATDGCSVMVMNVPETHPVAVSVGWEKQWRVPGEAIVASDYRMLQDTQLRAKGVLPAVERACAGEWVLQPPMSYDPQQTEHVRTGQAVKWFVQFLCPVRDASGAVVELVLIEHDVSDLHEIVVRNEALLREQRDLEASLRERNQELEERFAFIEAQQQAISALSVPVIQVWDGILVLPLVGMVDDARAERILSGLLSAITDSGAQQVIIDITGVPALDAAAANALIRAVAAARLVGAQCTLSGVSSRIAQTILTLDVELGALETSGTLKEALKRAMRRKDAADAAPARPSSRR